MTRVAIIGLGHLGYVTAAGLRNLDDVQLHIWDPDPKIMAKISGGQTTFDWNEPGLPVDLYHLQKTTLEEAVSGADIIWVCFDTPVNKCDVPDVQFVAEQVRSLFPLLDGEQTVLISSQVPIGFTRRMWAEFEFPLLPSTSEVIFVYSPENLRRGQGLSTFHHQERIVVGTQDGKPDSPLTYFLTGICPRPEWMTWESAEMTKHALNAFLGMSVAFANEIAVLCEMTGADPRAVERGLKTEGRIGQRAFLRPGDPYTGGTLGRDLAILEDLARNAPRPVFLPSAVRASNDARITEQEMAEVTV